MAILCSFLRDLVASSDDLIAYNLIAQHYRKQPIGKYNSEYEKMYEVYTEIKTVINF